MALIPGTRLGVYEVLAQIGVGGMGEVYRATDTKLKRQVALKVLPASVAGDADRLARFQREAEVLASLNHPNIAAIHGLEESDGIKALVMELVEGPTLADLLVRRAGPSGPAGLPLDEALPIAKQIAEALEAAHEQGIIHRDLKPANIKVRPDGTVKVLDFGLARAMEPAGSKDPAYVPPSQAPTITSPALLTGAGMILGTAAYMSPEQARGRPVDKRADIWAFGCVLYEVLTGARAFAGDDVTETLANVLKTEPLWERLPASLPPALGTCIRRCLHKDPRQRLRDIGDARLTLEGAFDEAAPRVAVPPAPTSSRWREWVTVAVALVAVVMAVGWWRASQPVNEVLRPLTRLSVDLGADVSLGSAAGPDAVISPDGTRIAYVSQGKLWTRRLDQQASTELAGTQGAFAPFFSPDGKWIAFFTASSLQRVSVEGGAAIIVSPAVAPRGGSWSEDGSIIATLKNQDGLTRIPVSGGSATPVTEIQPGGLTHRWPDVLPGGKAVLFTASTTGTAFDAATIEVVSLVDQTRKTLVRGGMFGRYVPSGHLLYVNRDTLFAVPFDVERLEVRGTPVPVLEQVVGNPADGSAQLAFSLTGTLLFRGGMNRGLLTVAWLEGTGKVEPLLAKPGLYGRPSLSPDGEKLAIEVSEGSGTDVWVHDSRREITTRVTFVGNAQSPLWSPDGRDLVFRRPGAGMAMIRADGASQPQPVTDSKDTQLPWSFTLDGKRLTFHQVGTTADLWSVPIRTDESGLRGGTPEALLQTSAEERYPAISPDGRWLAYSSDESGTFQVYVRALPDRGGKWQVSNSDGVYPMWSRTGHQLFFETLDNHIMAAAYTAAGETFVADRPRLWSPMRLGAVANTTKNFDLAADGKRIVALMPLESADEQRAQSHVTFLENFFDELRRKVPLDR